MSMKQAFKALGGVWPDDGKHLEYLHIGRYSKEYHCRHTSTAWNMTHYIGTRDEFEACRKEKWYLLTENGEIPTGAKRIRLSNGHITKMLADGWYMSNDQHAHPMAYTCE